MKGKAWLIPVLIVCLCMTACTKGDKKKSENDANNGTVADTGTTPGNPGNDPAVKYPGSYVCDTYAYEKGVRTKIRTDEVDLDADGREIFSSSWYLHLFGEETKTEIRTEYDSKGRVASLTTVTTKAGEDPSKVVPYIMSYEYDGDSDRIRFVREGDANEDYNRIQEIRYNESGDEILNKGTDSDGNFYWCHEMEYDAYGNLIYRKEVGAIGCSSPLESRREVVSAEYDAEQRKVTGYAVYWQIFDDDVTVTREKTYEKYYDESGRLNRMKVFCGEIDGEPYEMCTVEYQYKGGRVCSKSIMTFADGTIRENEFDALGKILVMRSYAEGEKYCEKMVCDWDTAKGILSKRMYYCKRNPGTGEESEAPVSKEELYFLTPTVSTESYGDNELFRLLTCMNEEWGHGLEVRDMEYCALDGAWRLEMYSWKEYLSEDDIEEKMKTTFDENGRRVNTRNYFSALYSEISTDYDDHGNIVKEVKLSDGEEPEQTEYEYTYY